jgi:outer membrane murein-binding lipoprotein Lpp
VAAEEECAMSEKETRRLLQRICEDLDRYARLARKLVLPTTLGAGVALAGCGDSTTPKPDSARGDVAKTDALKADASKADAKADTLKADLKKWDQEIPKPYMAPDAEPLYRSLERNS